MVSLMLDAVKFLLIYRYLQNIYWFKRENRIGISKSGFSHDRGKDAQNNCSRPCII